MEPKKQPSLTIVGCGPGSPDYMTEAGRQAIARASVLVGAPHLLKLYAAPDHESISVSANINNVLDAIALRLEQGGIAVLVSGDPCLCSLAALVIRRFGRQSCEVISGVSSVQLAFARLGIDWRNARILCAHSEIPDLNPSDLASFGCIAILAGHRHSQRWIADLMDSFEEKRLLVLCEDLSLPGERIRRVSVPEFRQIELSTRTVALILKEDMW